MRIALVHRDLHAVTRGGIGTLYRALAPRLRAAGCEVTLITQHSPGPLALQGTRVITLPRTDDMESHRQAVAETLASLAPDIAEASSWEAETLHYARLPRAARAPVVVRGDLSAATMRASLPLVTAERELAHAADAVLAVSGFAADDLASAYRIPRPVVTVNGADRARFRPGPATEPAGGHRIALAPDATAAASEPLAGGALPPPWADPGGGRRRLVWVGKATPVKGWDRLEQIARDLDGTAHVTVLLGHAPALSRITLAGTEDNVTILQDLPERDMPSFYRAADWLLSTSRWEGFGLAIAEALACGTPALLPAGLGTAPELLAADGGRTYRDTGDLRAILAADGTPAGTLPAALDWDATAAATLHVYQSLRKGRKVA
jgi:glycosyltransferase involved in cell wall biosynthesis